MMKNSGWKLRILWRPLFCLCLFGLFIAGAHGAGNGFLYALSEHATDGSQIYGYSVNEQTGALTQLPGFPVATGGNGSDAFFCERMVVDQANGRLYALNTGSNTVSAFAINRSTGALSALPFSPITLTGTDFSLVAVHPSGSPLLALTGTGDVSSFRITATTATPGEASPFNLGGGPFTGAFSRDGQFFYTGGNFGNSFLGFSVDPETGAVAALPGSPYDTTQVFPEAYATDPSGRLFLTNFSSGAVRVYTTDAAGVPAEVAGSPFNISGLTGAIVGLLHPNGFYIVADRSGNRVGVYQITGSGNATTMAAVGGSPFASGGTTTESLALSQSGTFLYAANGTSRNITTYQMNPTTGALSALVTQPADTMGGAGFLTSSLAYLRPPGGLMYLFNNSASGNKIFACSVHETTGALSPIFGFPIATGGMGSGASVENQQLLLDTPRNRLYAVNSASNTITVYRIDPTTGFLTELPFSPLAIPAADRPQLAVHPSGSPLLVNDSNGSLQSYLISEAGAVTAAGSPFSTGGAFPFSTAFSADGGFVYTGGNTGSTFAGFSVNAATGVLTPLAGSPYDTGSSFPVAYATDAAGRLFMANSSSALARAFTTTGGVPTAVTGSPFTMTTGGHIYGLLHPNGFYMVSDFSNERVAVLQIGGTGTDTTLAPVAGSPFAAGSTANETTKLELNATGTYLFALNNSSRNVTSFFVNSFTGALFSPVTLAVDAAGGNGSATGMVYVAEGALPTPTPAPPTPVSAPGVKVSGKKKIATSKAKFTLKGTSSSAAYVEVKVGKAKFKKAKGVANWKFKAKLVSGKNKVVVRAVAASGATSPPARITITRD